MTKRELEKIPKWMLKALPGNQVQYRHDYWCNCRPADPIGSGGCSCRIRRDFDALKDGTYTKPHGIGLIYPKIYLPT